MSPHIIAQQYLQGLAQANVEQLLMLFTSDAVVVSPLYGERLATDFYPQLFVDTRQADLTLKGVMQGEDPHNGTALVSIWFFFDWTLASGESAPFNVVDVLEIDAHSGLIAKLHIVYDTSIIRAVFEQSRTKTSQA
ncbi:hypothetical protein OPW32_24875 [Vibrio europaeus]|uniref:hypothetical protein n=1 Tax=Vibrio europaeus TaxID=300876 RepID=UPI002341344E|nr:hypothetical protein [Vibrio europaeus]MDC5852431.1 hypothetical protein [Vibrio europaeus]